MHNIEKIHLYTESYFWQTRLKNVIKFLLNRQWRGPQAVEKSLKQGLIDLKLPFDLNISPINFSTVGVLSGVATLKQVINWKRQGKIKTIIAGPNLVIGPYDFDSIVLDPMIDIFLAPSEWSVDFYVSKVPELKSKMRVWPAGVYVPPISTGSLKSLDFIIYNKIGQESLVGQIVHYLEINHLSYKIFTYGNFKQDEYFKWLVRSKKIIYLSHSESQGLGLFEAWARGVPSLVWERGLWEYEQYYWRGNTASPYVCAENGMIFKDFTEFTKVLPIFLKTNFSPKEFVENGFTYSKSAEKYLQIYHSLNTD